MDFKDNHQIWSQLSHELTQLTEQSAIDDKLLDESYETKVKEVQQLVKDIKKCLKEKDKYESELSLVEKAIDKANANIDKAETKSAQIQEYIDKMSKKCDENKENIENVMTVWNIIGLRMERKDDLYLIRFSKISDKEPEKWFSVKFTLDDNGVKVIGCDPKDSLDSQLIEKQCIGKTEESKPDVRQVIALIRNNLKKRNN